MSISEASAETWRWPREPDVVPAHTWADERQREQLEAYDSYRFSPVMHVFSALQYRRLIRGPYIDEALQHIRREQGYADNQAGSGYRLLFLNGSWEQGELSARCLLVGAATRELAERRQFGVARALNFELQMARENFRLWVPSENEGNRIQ